MRHLPSTGAATGHHLASESTSPLTASTWLHAHLGGQIRSLACISSVLTTQLNKSNCHVCVCACLCSLLDNAWKQELHRLHHGTAQLQTFRLQQAQAAKQRESLGSGPSSPGQHQGDEQDPGLGQAHEQHCHAHVNEQHEQDLGLSPLWDVLSNPCVHALMSAIQWHTTPSGQRFALHALDLSRSVPVGCTLHVYWVHCNCVCMRVCARACVCVFVCLCACICACCCVHAGV